MRVTAGVSSYRMDCEARNLAEDTLRWYEHKLALFVRWCEEAGVSMMEELTNSHIQAFSVWLRDRRGRTGELLTDYTVRGYVQVVKGWLAWAAQEEIVDARLGSRVTLPKVEKKLIRAFTKEQIAALYRACQTHRVKWSRYRDEAIVALLLETGLRADELCSLTVGNCLVTEREPSIIVSGKGRKQRILPVGKQTARLMHNYLTRWRPENEGDYVFVGGRSGQLTPDGLAQIIYRLTETAGTDLFVGVRYSPHTFRHTFAYNYMKQGGDVLRLSRLLGHSNLQTTENYLREFGSLDSRTGISIFDTMMK